MAVKFVLQRFLFAGLRRLSRFYPVKNEVYKKARVEPGVYRCAECKKGHPRTETVVDHISPVIDPTKGFVDWNTYVSRLFCAEDGLQVLCKPCHKVKTVAENKVRRSRKLKKKRSC